MILWIFGSLLIEAALLVALWVYAWPVSGFSMRYGWRARDKSIGQPVATEPVTADEKLDATPTGDPGAATTSVGSDPQPVPPKPAWSGRTDRMPFEAWLTLALVVCGVWIVVDSIPNIVAFFWNLQDDELAGFYRNLGRRDGEPVLQILIVRTLTLAIAIVLIGWPRQIVRLWRRLPGNRPGAAVDSSTDPARPPASGDSKSVE